MGASPSRLERDLRVGVADHGPGADARAVLELDPLAGGDRGDRNAAGEHGARLARRVGDREGDHPHAALDVAPDGAATVEVALVVHELDRGGAGLVGAAPGADDPLAVEGGLDPLVADVAVEHLGDRVLEDEIDHLLVAAEQLLDLGARRRVALPGVALALAQLLADVVEQLLVLPVAVDVGLGEAHLLEVGVRLGVVEVLAEGGAVLERDPEVRVGDPEAQPALAQGELVDDALVEQAEHVGARRDDDPVVVERALERRRAAEPVAALEHEHALAGAGQVGGGGQAVVAAADDHRVPVPRGHLGDGHRQPDLAEDGRDLVAGLQVAPVDLAHPQVLLTAAQGVHVSLGHQGVERVDVGLLAGVAAGDVAAVAHPELGQLADAPVLPVDGVPEVDGVAGIEVLARHRLGLEEPLAGHLGPVGGQRPERVQHHVVGMERDERVREEREVVDGVHVLLVESGDRRAVGGVAVAGAHRLGVLVEGHRAAAPGAGAEDGLAAAVVAERVQLRMDPRAVQALVVVLGDALPVRGDVVDDPAGGLQLAEPVALEHRRRARRRARRDRGRRRSGRSGAGRRRRRCGPRAGRCTPCRSSRPRPCAARRRAIRRGRRTRRGRGTGCAGGRCPPSR